MHIIGLDFTSAPRRQKPIMAVHADLQEGILQIEHCEALYDFSAFEALLERPGPWLAAMDFPFSQSRELIEGQQWPCDWSQWMAELSQTSKDQFKTTLDQWRAARPVGGKESPRHTDRVCGAMPASKLINPPVGLMFFEGAPRLWRSGVNLPPCRPNTSTRTVLEGYPGHLARQLIGRTSYKSDSKAKQTPARRQARQALLQTLLEQSFADRHSLQLRLSSALSQEILSDASGDRLDALLCAVQAAVAYRRELKDYGIPDDIDPLEGWIIHLP